MTKAPGQWALALSATSRMMGTFTAMRSSRLCPGLRGMPAVTMSTSAPAQSLHLEVPTTFPSKPWMAVFCSRSRALPLAKFSLAGMSNNTTSPSCLAQRRFASSPPMFPAPMSAIFFRVMAMALAPLRHILNDGVTELAAFDFFGSLHEPRKIVGHRLGADGAVHALDHEVGRLAPAHVPQHHLPGENDRAGIDPVEVGVLGRRSVGGLEDGVTGQVVDVAPGRDADAAHLRRQRIG